MVLIITSKLHNKLGHIGVDIDFFRTSLQSDRQVDLLFFVFRR